MIGGPPAGGKSSVARCFEAFTGVAVVGGDDLRHSVAARLGWTSALESRVITDRGVLGVLGMWCPYELTTVRALASRHADGVVDLSGGALFQPARDRSVQLDDALAAWPVRVLCCPHPGDPERATRVCAERVVGRSPDDDIARLWADTAVPLLVEASLRRAWDWIVIDTAVHTAEDAAATIAQFAHDATLRANASGSDP